MGLGRDTAVAERLSMQLYASDSGVDVLVSSRHRLMQSGCKVASKLMGC
jgi:hypothetical protein